MALESAVGGRIRWVVERHLRISQSEFARRLGVRQPLLSRWINNPDRPPGEASLEAIAAEAGVSLAWLRYGVGEPADTPMEPAGAQAITAAELAELRSLAARIVEIVEGAAETRRAVPAPTSAYRPVPRPGEEEERTREAS